MAIRAGLEPLLRKYDWLLPNWLNYVFVYYTNEESSTAARIIANYEYRNAQLNIASGWVLNDADYQERCVRHEFLHVVAEPLLNGIRDLHGMVKEKHPDTYKYLEEQIRFGNESFIVDLTEALSRFEAQVRTS